MFLIPPLQQEEELKAQARQKALEAQVCLVRSSISVAQNTESMSLDEIFISSVCHATSREFFQMIIFASGHFGWSWVMCKQAT